MQQYSEYMMEESRQSIAIPKGFLMHQSVGKLMGTDSLWTMILITLILTRSEMEV